MSARGHALDKFEREADGFFDRVRTAYLARAAAEPRRFRVIDSSRPLAEVRADLARIVEKL
jgi:dTMP kinase